jgi:hypothetical protein
LHSEAHERPWLLLHLRLWEGEAQILPGWHGRLSEHACSRKRIQVHSAIKCIAASCLWFGA